MIRPAKIRIPILQSDGGFTQLTTSPSLACFMMRISAVQYWLEESVMQNY